MKGFLIGVFVSVSFLACSMGSKKPDFDSFPIRAADQSIWQKCADSYDFVCKNICTEYTRKNECKKDAEKIERMEIKKALDAGYVMTARPFLLGLLKGEKL